jgi:hypothetical protein
MTHPVSGQQLGKHVSVATNTHKKKEHKNGVVYLVRVEKLYPGQVEQRIEFCKRG